MKLWWYTEWPQKVYNKTLTGKLISINILYYEVELINYAASYYYYLRNPDPKDPYPVV